MSVITDRPARRRHARRWVVIAAAALLVLIVVIAVATRLFIAEQSPAAPLRLPAGHAAPAAGPVAGTWTAATGSVAGFRVAETAFGASNVVVGRTSAVTGSFLADGSGVTRSAFQVRLTAIRVGGKAQPQLASSLATGLHPTAEITLTGPIALSPPFAAGTTIHRVVRGVLTLSGTSRPVTITLDARRVGSAIQVAGSVPVSFAAWHISRPAGFGWFGSLADRGTAEFFLVLIRARV